MRVTEVDPRVDRRGHHGVLIGGYPSKGTKGMWSSGMFRKVTKAAGGWEDWLRSENEELEKVTRDA